MLFFSGTIYQSLPQTPQARGSLVFNNPSLINIPVNTNALPKTSVTGLYTKQNRPILAVVCNLVRCEILFHVSRVFDPAFFFIVLIYSSILPINAMASWTILVANVVFRDNNNPRNEVEGIIQQYSLNLRE